MSRKRKKRRNKRRGQSILLGLFVLLLFLVLVWLASIVFRTGMGISLVPRMDIQETEEMPVIQTEAETESETESEAETETETETEEIVPAPEIEEADIYTFMQGPKAYKEKVDFGGEWNKEELAGSVFAEFGCGMCCMANLYSTFSPYECSPLDMYYYAKEVTDYSPGGGYGAIAWEFMQKALEKCGFTSKLHKKDDTYREFVRNLEKGWAAVALVSCYDDDKYWKTTPGHYITIWKYDKDTKTVFLGDSGDPEHNRQRIPLEYVYSAFKTSDNYQYLLIKSFDEEKNTWKHDGIKEKWNKPVGYVPKSERK